MKENNLRLVTKSDTRKKLPSWIVSYDFKGEQWGISIPARTEEEALARLRALGTTGRIEGELKFSMPAWTDSNWIPNIVIHWLNFWRKMR